LAEGAARGFARLFERTRPAGRLALLPYVMAGHPTVASTVDLLLGLEAAGADGFELGVPFSDPVADGPTIQSASQVALRNGMTPARTTELLAEARRRGLRAPVALMGYLNPIVHRGVGRYCAEAAAAGADGLIVPDAPPEEADDLERACQACRLDLIQFVAPTSSAARIALAAGRARGFVYVVSLTGVTGARAELAAGLDALLERVRALTTTPVVVGFGISRPEHLAHLRGRADGAIVASALINRMDAAPDAPLEAATAFLRELRAGADGVVAAAR
jgi:tryptophan synthase alpha chain